MAFDPSLAAIFGANAIQDATTLTITKLSLVDTSTPKKFIFTPSADNRAETLFLALLLKAKEGQDTSADAQMRIGEPTMSLVAVPIPGNPDKVKLRYQFTIQFDNDVVGDLPSPDLI